MIYSSFWSDGQKSSWTSKPVGERPPKDPKKTPLPRRLRVQETARRLRKFRGGPRNKRGKRAQCVALRERNMNWDLSQTFLNQLIKIPKKSANGRARKWLDKEH